MKHIAKIYTDFTEKFGLPRQSGIVNLPGKIVLEPPYRNMECLKGLEGFSHIWLIWEFSKNLDAKETLTARPPRLGGNVRKGVFATRSPFRPNPIGLSVVELLEIKEEKDGPVLYVNGVDMLNGTPIYDIKPYLPYCESIPDAIGGFTEKTKDYILQVEVTKEFQIPEQELNIIMDLLAQDPKPGYHDDPNRIYGMKYKDYDVKFKFNDQKVIITDIAILS